MLEHHQIAAFLPHRHPVLLVDRVLAMNPGDRLVAIKAISASEPCYAGLGSDRPRWAFAYPASLVVESLGQAGALLWRCSRPPTSPGGEPDPAGTLLFGALRGCRLTGRAYPGDTLRHVVRLELATPHTAVLSGETWVADNRIAVVDTFVAAVRPDARVAPGGAGGTGHRETQQRRNTDSKE